MQKPFKRGRARLLFGKIYYLLKKYIYWHLPGNNFASERKNILLPCEVFVHKTPLLRDLRGADMWMQYNKITNLKIAIGKINGLVLYPGQVFSYWRQIGRVTRRDGYKEGMILRDGKIMPGLGGGLCQLSNLIYWATLHTPLRVIERWRHCYDVFPDENRKQPFGSGATCAYPNIDLQILNDTSQSFQLSIGITDGYLVGRWLSDKPAAYNYLIVEKDSKIDHEWWGGYTRNNKIYRKVIDSNSGKEIREERITENHAIMMYNPFITEKIIK